MNSTHLTSPSSRNALGKQRAYSSNAFERESVLYPGVDIAPHRMSQSLPMALGKCRLEAQGCVSRWKARIARSSHQQDPTRHYGATVAPRVPSIVRWLGWLSVVRLSLHQRENICSQDGNSTELQWSISFSDRLSQANAWFHVRGHSDFDSSHSLVGRERSAWNSQPSIQTPIGYKTHT